eukprot:GILJ01001891.1.p1 GENE.GILJ01001891.1~~GILJ01001891.1.p1  ORF type:complete len:434 (-),score=52.61 GILJ01001891.1:134-1435(-)
MASRLVCVFLCLCLAGVRASDVGSTSLDPDTYRNCEQLITSKGFPFEGHETLTEDGFVLGLHRIPGSRAGAVASKGVVLFQHGLLASSEEFVMNTLERSPALVLADAGYDVWMGNNRGNPYSTKHTHKSRLSAAYWDFSYDEMGLYDVPATINYILDNTGAKTLTYIGHSEGTSQMFAALSLHPNLSNKINLFIAITPIGWLGHQSMPLLSVLAKSGVGELLYHLGLHEFNPAAKLQRDLLAGLCAVPLFSALCDDILSMVDPYAAQSKRVPIYVGHFPESTSSKCLLHYAQSIVQKTFARFDLGHTANLAKYGTATAPAYNVSAYTVPMVFFAGGKDPLGNPTDVERMASELPANLLKWYQTYPHYGHMAFVAGDDADVTFIPDLLMAVEKYAYVNNGPVLSVDDASVVSSVSHLRGSTRDPVPLNAAELFI